ncbi:hypothetical protein RchiOBHm_Chr4g0423131 [Rosa chinensis]|uniref:Uncharacterized protein n=1 Tax=Rosa chinensis TaxID=74649 RepID=A0A2P6QYI5_ROSCH|nr:hypothetical protein RchiOBHm_Chr4g0423131 [Rosa chinensis]
MTIFKNRDMASTPSMPRNTATINPFKTVVIFSVKNIKKGLSNCKSKQLSAPQV